MAPPAAARWPYGEEPNPTWPNCSESLGSLGVCTSPECRRYLLVERHRRSPARLSVPIEQTWVLGGTQLRDRWSAAGMFTTVTDRRSITVVTARAAEKHLQCLRIFEPCAEVSHRVRQPSASACMPEKRHSGLFAGNARARQDRPLLLMR